jgi:CRISPR-associated protein Cas2
MYVLVYDVVNDPRRNRLHRSLKNFGTAVQRSVFEFDLAPRDARKMMEHVERIVDQEEDVVRMYRICDSCLRTVRVLGEGEPSIDTDYYVI